MERGMKLSVACVAGNEHDDHLFEGCLAQWLGIADQVVVVCSGEDGTAEMAAGLGAEVYRHSWPCNFSIQRNRSLSYCRGEWVLVLDADELLSDPFIDLWKSGESLPEGVDGFIFLMHHFARVGGFPVMLHGGGWANEPHLRLFRNTREVFFSGELHEMPKGLKHMAVIPHYIHHYGWCRNEALLEAKIARRNAEEVAAGTGPGTHTLGEPHSELEVFGGVHPAAWSVDLLRRRG
jgi:hypothetical protein